MYDIFLSYRHSSGATTASFICDALTRLGYNVFLDKDMHSGEFPKQIYDAIDECTYLFVLLFEGDLDRSVENPEEDWIVREVKHALDRGKVVIPLKMDERFDFPKTDQETIKKLSNMQMCDLFGPYAAELIETRLLKMMKDNPSKKLADEYNKGIADPEYLKWELETLKGIYHDIPFSSVLGREYPVYTVEGSDNVKYPFDSLTGNSKLSFVETEMSYSDGPYYKDFKRIVGPHIHYPNLYGFTSNGFIFDDEGKIYGFNAIPRTYKETVYSCHILQYELWEAYKKLGKRMATLDDLPMRRAIHEGHTNMEVILSGCNRSSLCDVSIAVLAYNSRTREYRMASAIRTENVATFPGYFSIVPSGGFELYELETCQTHETIKENFIVSGALYREYLEELFDGKSFGKPTGNNDLDRLFDHEKIKQLDDMVKKGVYQFEFLGVNFDLITLRQTFAFVLRIDDANFDHKFVNNEENQCVKSYSLKSVEKTIANGSVPVMVEAAGTYHLLTRNHLFKEILEKGTGLIE